MFYDGCGPADLTTAAAANERGEAWATDRQRALTWARRLKRVFAIEIRFGERRSPHAIDVVRG